MAIKYHEIDLVNFLQAFNEPIRQISHHYYRHEAHDSLVIDSKKNYFHWNSQNVSGGVIQYLMSVKGMSKAKAMATVHEVTKNSGYISHQPITIKKEPFHYDSSKEVTGYHFAYLEKRGLSKSLIQTLFDKQLIAFNQQQHVVFKWYDEGKLVGCSFQGTTPLSKENQNKYGRKFFKQIHKNSQENWGFNLNIGTPNKMIAFESPIDCLSYLTLNQATCHNAILVSLEGLKKETLLNFITKTHTHYPLEKIQLCVDNDKGGINFTNDFKHHKNFEVIRPKNKDWNDDLLSSIGRKSKAVER